MVARIPDQRAPQTSAPKSRKRDPWTDHPCADCAALGAHPDQGYGLISIDSPAVLHRCRRRGLDDAIANVDQDHFDSHGTSFRARLPYAAEIRELRLLDLGVPANGRGLHVEIRRLVTGQHRRTYVWRGRVVWGRDAWPHKDAVATSMVGAVR